MYDDFPWLMGEKGIFGGLEKKNMAGKFIFPPPPTTET